MDWPTIIWLGMVFVMLVIMGLIDDYYTSEYKGWKPIVDFPKVWERIKGLFRRTP